MKNVITIYLWLIVLIMYNSQAQSFDSIMVDSCWQGEVFRETNNYRVITEKKEVFQFDSTPNRKNEFIRKNSNKTPIELTNLMQLSKDFLAICTKEKEDSIIRNLLYANAFQNKNQLSYNLYIKFLDSLYYSNRLLRDTLLRIKISKLLLIASIGVGLSDMNIEGCKSNFNFKLQKKANHLYKFHQPDICCHCFLVHPMFVMVEWTQEDLNKQLNCLFQWLSSYSKDSSDICCILMLRSRFFSHTESLEEKYNGHKFYD